MGCELTRNNIIELFTYDLVTMVESNLSRVRDSTSVGKVPEFAEWEKTILDNFEGFQWQLLGQRNYYSGILSTLKVEKLASHAKYRVCKEFLLVIRMHEVSKRVEQFVHYRCSFPREFAEFFGLFYFNRTKLNELFGHCFWLVESDTIRRDYKDSDEGKASQFDEWEKKFYSNFEKCQQELQQRMNVCVGIMTSTRFATLEDESKSQLCQQAMQLMRMKEVAEKVEYSLITARTPAKNECLSRLDDID